MTSELTERVSPATPIETGTVRSPAVTTMTGEAAVVEPLRVDHVRSHSKGCYWDFVECRWQCSTP